MHSETLAQPRSKVFVRYLIFLLLFTAISGAIRKWLPFASGLNNIVFLVQLLVLPASLLLLLAKSFQPAKGMFLLFGGYLVFAANPLNLTIFHGALGLLVHCGWWLVLFIYFRNRENLSVNSIIWYAVLVVVSQFVLATIQYSSSPEAFINRYANANALGESVGAALVGSAVRVTGTFSYISGFTAFLIFVPFFCWGLIRANRLPLLAISVLVAGIPVCLMSGSRLSVLIYSIFTIYILLRNPQFLKRLLGPLVVVFSLLVMVNVVRPDLSLSINQSVKKAFDNFDERRTEQKKAGEEKQRIFWDWEQLANFNHKNWLTGVGLGATYQGATSMFGTSRHVQEYGYYETENARILLETGVFGLLLRFILGIYISFQIRVPTVDKWFLAFFNIFLFTYVFNVYNAAFGALGLIFLDNLQPSQASATTKP